MKNYEGFIAALKDMKPLIYVPLCAAGGCGTAQTQQTKL